MWVRTFWPPFEIFRRKKKLFTNINFYSKVAQEHGKPAPKAEVLWKLNFKTETKTKKLNCTNHLFNFKAMDIAKLSL